MIWREAKYASKYLTSTNFEAAYTKLQRASVQPADIFFQDTSLGSSSRVA